MGKRYSDDLINHEAKSIVYKERFIKLIILSSIINSYHLKTNKNNWDLLKTLVVYPYTKSINRNFLAILNVIRARKRVCPLVTCTSEHYCILLISIEKVSYLLRNGFYTCRTFVRYRISYLVSFIFTVHCLQNGE